MVAGGWLLFAKFRKGLLECLDHALYVFNWHLYPSSRLRQASCRLGRVLEANQRFAIHYPSANAGELKAKD